MTATLPPRWAVIERPDPATPLTDNELLAHLRNLDAPAAAERATAWREAERARKAIPEYVEAHAAFCAGLGMSPRTVEDRRELLCRVHAARGHLDDLTADQILGWFEDSWSAQTRATYFRHVKGFYRWRVEVAGVLARSPLDRVPNPRVPQMEPREPTPQWFVEHVLSSAPEPWLTAAILARFAGLRAIETAALRREDVTERRIRTTGKGGKVADIPTHPRVWEHLRDRPAGPVVLAARGRPFTASGLSVGYGKWARAEGPNVEATSLHRLRHAFCQALRRAGVDVRVIQTLMRHESIATTQRYMAVDEDERRSAIFGI